MNYFRANIIQQDDPDDLINTVKRLLIPGSKTAKPISNKDLAWFRFDLNITAVPELLKDRFSGNYYCLFTKINHRFIQTLAKKLQQFVEAGLLDYNSRYWFDKTDPKRVEVETGPQVLTLNELEAGFVVCMVPLAISIIAFGLEWLPTLKDLIVFSFIFKQLFEIRFSSQQTSSRLWFNRLQKELQAKAKKLVKFSERHHQKDRLQLYRTTLHTAAHSNAEFKKHKATTSGGFPKPQKTA